MPGSWRAASPGTEGRERKGLGRNANRGEAEACARTHGYPQTYARARPHTHTQPKQRWMNSRNLGVCRGRRRGKSVGKMATRECLITNEDMRKNQQQRGERVSTEDPQPREKIGKVHQWLTHTCVHTRHLLFSLPLSRSRSFALQVK